MYIHFKQNVISIERKNCLLTIHFAKSIKFIPVSDFNLQTNDFWNTNELIFVFFFFTMYIKLMATLKNTRFLL